MTHLVKGPSRMALDAHVMPKGLQHFKGDIQQELVEEMHHVLTQAVTLVQCVVGPPVSSAVCFHMEIG